MEESVQKIKTLYSCYEDNPEIISLLNVIINNEIPDRLNLIDKTNKLSKAKIEQTKKNKEIFIQEFLCRNNYFYIEKSNLFFCYDNNDYVVCNEDDISHLILTEINNTKQFNNIKYKIKSEIFDHIKNNSLLNSIPESDTIQRIILLFKSIFSTTDEVKYFLSLIGDNILQKENTNIQLTSIYAQTFLKEFDRKAYFYLEKTLINSVRFKYHDQDYKNICLLYIPKHIQTIDSSLFFKNNLINIIVVCCYFSKRFKSSDLFLVNHASKELYNYANFLKLNTFDTILNKFIDDYIEPSKDQTISWKNMLFLWNNFLDKNKLPQIVFTNILKKNMIDKFKNYNQNSSLFLNYTSKHIPSIAKFLSFWNEYMILNETEYKLEISELKLILKRHINSNYDEETLINLINHYYNEVNIENNKFINGYSCLLWDKKKNIEDVLMQDGIFTKPMSIYKTYSTYCDLSNEQGKLVVSKNYFEEYIRRKYKNKITNNVIYFC